VHYMCHIICRFPQYVYRRRRLVSILTDVRVPSVSWIGTPVAPVSWRWSHNGVIILGRIYIICYVLFVDVLSVSLVVAPGCYFVS